MPAGVNGQPMPMAEVRQLEEINNSGELVGIKLRGIDDGSALQTKDEIQVTIDDSMQSEASAIIGAYLAHAKSVLIDPVTVTDAEGEVTVLSFTTDNYNIGDSVIITLSFVSAFDGLNDQVNFKLTGDIESLTFLKESKDENEVVPFSYSFPVVMDREILELNLVVFVTGSPGAEVVIRTANLFSTRVG
ncbi:MAG: hypothetical protein DRN30_06170 [Thermoplasmata archaeon]|nr:MAG: hypothetical protein DRN30_06170 [Thermoplasmata archaeon]